MNFLKKQNFLRERQLLNQPYAESVNAFREYSILVVNNIASLSWDATRGIYVEPQQL
jgi:hypothetical protein